MAAILSSVIFRRDFRSTRLRDALLSIEFQGRPFARLRHPIIWRVIVLTINDRTRANSLGLYTPFSELFIAENIPAEVEFIMPEGIELAKRP